MKEEFPGDLIGDVLRRLRRSGDKLTAPRIIDFSVIFKTEAGAIKFCDLIKAVSEGVKWEYDSDISEEYPWDVRVQKHMVPSHTAITEFERHIELMAAPLGGKNDGWGCFEIVDD